MLINDILQLHSMDFFKQGLYFLNPIVMKIEIQIVTIAEK